jgi:hypothetical protein
MTFVQTRLGLGNPQKAFSRMSHDGAYLSGSYALPKKQRNLAIYGGLIRFNSVSYKLSQEQLKLTSSYGNRTISAGKERRLGRH